MSKPLSMYEQAFWEEEMRILRPIYQPLVPRTTEPQMLCFLNPSSGSWWWAEVAVPTPTVGIIEGQA